MVGAITPFVAGVTIVADGATATLVPVSVKHGEDGAPDCRLNSKNAAAATTRMILIPNKPDYYFHLEVQEA